jgi:PhnB protein
MLSYHDAPAALEFLGKAFGFEELFRLDMPDGRVGHAEVGYDGVRIMIASEYPEMGIGSPRNLDTRYSQLWVRVDDVDAHHAQAKSAGATIVTAPEDDGHGYRSYRSEDPEGHRWIFASALEEAAE